MELLPKRNRDPANNYAVRWIVPLGRRSQVWQFPGVPCLGTQQRRAAADAENSYAPSNLSPQYTFVATRAAVTR